MLRYLSQKNALPTEVAEQLIDAYWFCATPNTPCRPWRTDKPALPSSPLEQARLAWVMGFEHWQAFYAALNQHRDCVSREFAAVVAAPMKATSKIATP